MFLSVSRWWVWWKGSSWNMSEMSNNWAPSNVHKYKFEILLLCLDFRKLSIQFCTLLEPDDTLHLDLDGHLHLTGSTNFGKNCNKTMNSLLRKKPTLWTFFLFFIGYMHLSILRFPFSNLLTVCCSHMQVWTAVSLTLIPHLPKH